MENFAGRRLCQLGETKIPAGYCRSSTQLLNRIRLADCSDYSARVWTKQADARLKPQRRHGYNVLTSNRECRNSCGVNEGCSGEGPAAPPAVHVQSFEGDSRPAAEPYWSLFLHPVYATFGAGVSAMLTDYRYSSGHPLTMLGCVAGIS